VVKLAILNFIRKAGRYASKCFLLLALAGCLSGEKEKYYPVCNRAESKAKIAVAQAGISELEKALENIDEAERVMLDFFYIKFKCDKDEEEPSLFTCSREMTSKEKILVIERNLEMLDDSIRRILSSNYCAMIEDIYFYRQFKARVEDWEKNLHNDELRELLFQYKIFQIGLGVGALFENKYSWRTVFETRVINRFLLEHDIRDIDKESFKQWLKDWLGEKKRGMLMQNDE